MRGVRGKSKRTGCGGGVLYWVGYYSVVQRAGARGERERIGVGGGSVFPGVKFYDRSLS